MIAAFDSMLGGKIFDASQASSDDFEIQSKILSVMSATCDHLAIQSAIPKAHLTPNTTARRCEAP